MEILNNIWTALTNENEILTKILGLPFVFIEGLCFMLLFTQVLDITSSKKQKIIYVSFWSILGVICSILIPKPFSNILNLVLVPIAICCVFKINILRSIFAEFIPLICITVLEILLARVFLIIFNTDYEACANIPLFRITINFIIYAMLFLIYKICKKLNFHIHMVDKINVPNKVILSANILFAIIVIFMQMYLIVFYNDKLPSFIILINILSLIAYFAISIFSMVKTMKLEKATADLEQERLYNKTLQILHDNMRAFKHDFSNIVSGIGGYVSTNDISGLKKYYNQLLQECNQNNNLSCLNPNTINNPAVYSILANKYYKADELGIKINLECFIDFNTLHMEIYEFTRILGILMDNAIEAACECDKKLISVFIRNDLTHNRQLLIIENTYKNKDINLDQIYEKGYSTKPANTGLGLWEVNKIISKHKNLSRYTTKTDELFRQQIEIYDE